MSHPLDPYIKVLFFRSFPDLGTVDGAYRKEELIKKISINISGLLKKFEFHTIVDSISSATHIFNQLSNEKVIYSKDIEFSGKYYFWNRAKAIVHRNVFLKSDKIQKESTEIGARYFLDIFEGYKKSISDDNAVDSDHGESDNSLISTQIPASDRLVTLTHNQQSEIDKPLNNVISLVEAENSINGQEGIRELILGRLKAGRELINAGIFTIQTIQLTLVVGLKMLAEKYKDHTIGALAGNLMNLLFKEMGL